MAVPASAMPNMPHLFGEREVARCGAMLLMSATRTVPTDINLARIRSSLISPRATSVPQQTPGFLIMQKIELTPAATSPTRQDRHLSTSASAVFSLKPICSASPRQWMRDGFRSCLTTKDAFGCRRCGMWTKGRTRPLSKLMGTTDISRASKPSCISTTRDILPRCQPNDPDEGTTCWPAPESTDNMNTKRMGRLGLSDAEEDALVSFMQTLTDGFMSRDQP
jgi:hypothetical protein